jgi:TrmH family RNA methyltransferase
MLITSTSNATIKRIRALRQRKERERSGLFFIEGIRIVAEAAQMGAAIEALVTAPDLLNSSFARQLVATQQQAGVVCHEVSASVFQSLSSKEGPQGLAAVVRQQWQPLAQAQPGPGLAWVVLDRVQDPGNLGTILRTCDAVGCAGVMLLGSSSDPYDPAALRASMGAVFAQRLVRTDMPALLAWKQQHACPLVGAAGAAARDYQAARYRSPLLLLMGSEREGLSPEQQAACDAVVSIPMVGRSDSLNLAVATGVLLYEIFNQQR